MRNLLAANKNAGWTHLTNGAYRLHPLEWNVGEAAGALAAFCLEQAVAPAAVLDNAGLRLAFQDRLIARGVPLYWLADLSPDDAVFAAAHWLGARGGMPGDSQRLELALADLASNEEESRVAALPAGSTEERERVASVVARLPPGSTRRQLLEGVAIAIEGDLQV